MKGYDQVLHHPALDELTEESVSAKLIGAQLLTSLCLESFAKFHGCVLKQFRELAVEEDGLLPMILTVKAHTFHESGNGRKYSIKKKRVVFNSLVYLAKKQRI